MTRETEKPMWIPRRWNGATRYYREGPGGYQLRHVMDAPPPGKPFRKRWALFAGNRRVWDVQPLDVLGAAMEQAERWITKGG